MNMYYQALTTAIIIALMSPTLQAQGPTRTGADELIEEIVVTAERRAQSLQEVPVAITALTADTIERERVEKLSDIALLTPNFAIGQQSPTQPELTIRGIGSTDREAGSDRSVVVFVDEVYIGRAGASTFDLFDLERIEVLRGPQGTLYGRNVVGGAINLITAKPTAQTRSRLHLGTGSEGLAELKGMVSGALSYGINGKLSASIKSRDGFWTHTDYDENDMATGTRNSGAPSSQSLRGQLHFEPNSGLDATITLETSSDEMDGVPSAVSQGATTDANYLAGLSPFFPADHVPDSLPAPFESENNFFGEITRDSTALYANINLEKPYGIWTLIPAWRQNDLSEFRDIAGMNIRLNNTGRPKGFNSTAINDEAYTATSFEVRLASPDGGGAEWVAGLYFLNEDIARDQIRHRQANHGNSRPLFDQDIATTSMAAFGQVKWRMTERANLTLGGRYTTDDKSFDMAVSDTLTDAQKTEIQAKCNPAVGSADPLCQATTLNPATEEYTASASDSWAEFTPRLSLDFKLSDSWLMYGTLSQGFKSGGFVGLAASKTEAEIPFAPETADNLELGFKGSLANRYQFNISYFSMNFNDLQLRRRILTIPGDDTSAIVTTSNAAEAKISGLELEMRAAPTDNLRLTASVSTLDTEVTKTEDATAIFVGRALPRAPESLMSLGINYFVPLGTAELEVGGNLHSIGEFYFDINEQPPGLEPSHTLMNFHLNYNTGKWSLGLWVKNLTDETYRTHVQSIRAVNGLGRAGITQYGDPMTWGLSLKWDRGS